MSDVPAHGNKCRQLQPQTLPQFLISLYEYDPTDESRDVFHEISIHRCSSVHVSTTVGIRTLWRLFSINFVFSKVMMSPAMGLYVAVLIVSITYVTVGLCSEQWHLS